MTGAPLIVIQDPDDIVWALRSKSFAPVRPESGHGAEYVAMLTRASLADLYGPDHAARRRILSALFTRSRIAEYENVYLKPRLAELVATNVANADNHSPDEIVVDLLELTRRIFLSFMTRLIGLDALDGDAFLALHDDLVAMERLARAKFVDDPELVVAPALAAQDRLIRRFFEPALRRREQALQPSSGNHSPGDLDLLTLMLQHRDHYDHWDSDLVFREMTLFVNASVGSTSGAVCDAVYDLSTWALKNPERRYLLVDPDFLGRASQESLRRHQVTVLKRTALDEVALPSGQVVPRGHVVALDRSAVNAKVQADSDPPTDEFDPDRELTGARYGLAFGAGAHTCIARPSVLGISQNSDDEAASLGLLVVTLQELFAHGVRTDPAHPPQAWPDMSRHTWRTFPVVFDGAKA